MQKIRKKWCDFFGLSGLSGLSSLSSLPLDKITEFCYDTTFIENGICLAFASEHMYSQKDCEQMCPDASDGRRK